MRDGPATVDTEGTGNRDPQFFAALCSCCVAHGKARMGWRTVTCRECGQPCSCEGCAAEAEG